MVRSNHVFVNDGICGISTGKGRDRQIIEQGEDQRYGDPQRSHGKQGKEDNIDRRDQRNAQNSHQIPLDSKNAENERIFENLSKWHIKSNQHEIEIKSHEEIQNHECQNRKVAKICPKRAWHSHKVSEIEHQQENSDYVDQAE